MATGYPMKEGPPARSGAGKWLIGCAIAGGVGLLLCCGGGVGLSIWGVRTAVAQAEAFVKPFEQQGYKRESGQSIKVNQPIQEKHVYLAQVVEVEADASSDVAFAAQMVEINSTINGNVDFFGQVLKIGPKGVVKGNINAKLAQVVEVQGTVEGEITGSIQVKNITGKVGTRPAPAEAPRSSPEVPPAGQDGAT